MLNEFGSWSYIYELENKWKNVSVVDLNNGKIKSSSLLLFLKKKENEIYSITTESNKKIKVSGDHPILTATGMKNASELKDGEEIVTYPFSGVKHEEPSDKIILTIEDVKKYLEKIGISDRGNAKVQVINRLKELNILPLKYNSPQLPILIKIMGFILGDGVLIFLKNKKGYIHFYGKEEDLISWCANRKNVMYITKRIGTFDYEINVAIIDINDLNSLFSEMKSKFGNIIDSHELIINSQLLKLNYLPL